MENNRKISFTGEIVLPDNIGYNDARQIWNRAIDRYPLGILYCENESDIIGAVLMCTRKKMPFRLRGGGHNYEGYSIGNNVVVIDLSRIKTLEINEYENTVKVGAGVTNRELYECLGSEGYPFPGGTCPTVGVVGYTLGGGWGLSCRLFGLGCDNVKEIEMINYKGEKIVANKLCNNDLFWALRGAGGGNFGVVTSITYNLPPKFNRVTLFTIKYDDTSTLEQVNIMNEFQNLFLNLDMRVNMRLSIANSIEDGRTAFAFGFFYGEEEEVRCILEPLLIIPKAISTFETTSFLEAIRKVMSIYPESEKFKSGGCFENSVYDKEELIKMAILVRERPEGSVYTAITFFGLGGAVKNKEDFETAFYYRNANYIIGLQSVWENDEYAQSNRLWLNEKMSELNMMTKGHYVNFPYSPLENYLTEYYGSNLKNLTIVAKKYDPLNVFKFPQYI